jgi:hypothetical protein
MLLNNIVFYNSRSGFLLRELVLVFRITHSTWYMCVVLRVYVLFSLVD